jgi:membrane-associated PAP2 superfamily phosphatase
MLGPLLIPLKATAALLVVWQIVRFGGMLLSSGAVRVDEAEQIKY